MTRYLTLLLTALLLLSVVSAYSIIYSAPASEKVVVAVDLAHGESDKYLDYIMGNITWVEWKTIETAITTDVLSDVDVLILGQPTTGFSPDEMSAIQEWLSQGNKVLWVAGDSDYPPGPVSQEACNDLLEFIGAKLRLEFVSVGDNVNNAGEYYRVLTRVMPDDVPELYTVIIAYNINKPILMHGPTAVIWVDENGGYHDPVNETFDGLIRIVWSYDTSYIYESSDPLALLYNQLFYGEGTGNHTFVMVAAEHWKDYNDIIVVSGESPYGAYEPMWASEYHGVKLDGPTFITNMIRWFTIVAQRPVRTVTMTTTQVFTETETMTTTQIRTTTSISVSTTTVAAVEGTTVAIAVAVIIVVAILVGLLMRKR